MNDDFRSYLAARKALIDGALDAVLPPATDLPAEIHGAMRYAALGGGKRLRPILSLAVADIAECPHDRVIDAACAVELVHAASLVLDDLPAMDNAAMRRDGPSVHVQFGESTAMLAAVALLALAYELVPRSAELCGRPESAGKAVQTLAQAMGSQGIVSGQFEDLTFTHAAVPDDRIEDAYQRKSGALFRAAVLVPAHLVGFDSSVTNALDRYAGNIGLAFQITDDLLDAGKTNEDAGKATALTCMGRQGARKRAARLLNEAVQTIERLGPGAEPLRLLAALIEHRIE